MKHFYKAFIIALLLHSANLSAQCTTCTTTITGADASNHVVGVGTTLCVSSSGSLTGLILVSGGTLCNQGTITTTNLAVTNGGTFNNYGSANVDSILVTQSGSVFTNYGTSTNLRLASTSNASITNNGTITVDYLGDSVGTFTNNASLTVNFDFGNAYNSNFQNNGSFIVSRDFGNSYSSTFTNNTTLNIGRDFYNSTSAVLTTNCMASVGRDWYNTATLNGPSTASCGGFNIVGNSYNTGTVGSASQHVDLCDAGHPGTGIDGPSGTIASTTTYCACSNACTTPSGITEPSHNGAGIISLYPNPAANMLTVIVNNDQSRELKMEVIDMTGKAVSAKTVKAIAGEQQLTIDVTSLAKGTYILNITGSGQFRLSRIFSVVKD